MSNVKTFNLELKVSQTHGQRADEPFAQLGYRSRQNPKQSCYIPDDAVTEHGVYHTILNRENARTGSTTTKNRNGRNAGTSQPENRRRNTTGKMKSHAVTLE